MKNTAIEPANTVTLASLVDDFYGDITVPHGAITATTCATGIPIAMGATYTCAFTAKVSGNAGYYVDDEVTASGMDIRKKEVAGSSVDSPVVTVTNVLPKVSVSKVASKYELLEPGDNVTFTVTVIPDIVSTDPVTLNLVDTIYGSLNGKGDCKTGITIQSGKSYSCTFAEPVSGNAGYVETGKVTATVTDDEGYWAIAEAATTLKHEVWNTICLTSRLRPLAVFSQGRI